MYTGFNEIKLYGKEEDAIEEFITINGEKLDCNYSLDYYMQAVDNILNKDGIYD